jgi:hypothetical protein
VDEAPSELQSRNIRQIRGGIVVSLDGANRSKAGGELW